AAGPAAGGTLDRAVAAPGRRWRDRVNARRGPPTGPFLATGPLTNQLRVGTLRLQLRLNLSFIEISGRVRGWSRRSGFRVRVRGRNDVDGFARGERTFERLAGVSSVSRASRITSMDWHRDMADRCFELVGLGRIDEASEMAEQAV